MFLIKISVALVLVAATIAAVLALPVPGNTLSTGEEHLDGHNPGPSEQTVRLKLNVRLANIIRANRVSVGPKSVNVQ